MEVLIVSYNFPPLNRMGSGRMYSWAHELSAVGASVTVLTPEKTNKHGSLDYAMPRSAFSLVEVKAPDWALRGARMRRAAWLVGSSRWLQELEVNPRIVISSLGPPESHYIAALAKRRFSDAFWIADYRDLWSGNAYDSRPFVELARSLLEPRVVAGADVITTVSAGFAERLCQRHPGHRVEVIENGYEGELAEPHRMTSSPVRIVYTGTIYPSKRDPTPLFVAVRKLLDSGHLSLADVSVEFYGAEPGDVGSLAQKCGVQEAITVAGHVSRADAIRLQEQADILLLLDWPNPDASGTVPAKVYEYMRALRPIIGVGVLPNSSVGRLLYETGTGIPCGQDVDLLCATIASVTNGSIPWFNPQLDRIRRFSRTAQAKKLVELVAPRL